MSTIYEKYGRKCEQFDDLDAAYTELLKLLATVVCGEVDPRRVLVNLTDRTWQRCEVGQRTATPCTINGLPLCVVAPPDPEPVPLSATIPPE